MEEVRGFFDLCIAENCFRDHFESTVKQLKECKFFFVLIVYLEKTNETFCIVGYKTVAVNQVVEEANLETKKKKKKGESREIGGDVVPAPIVLPSDSSEVDFAGIKQEMLFFVTLIGLFSFS